LSDGHININVVETAQRKLKTCRHYAHDGVGLAVKCQALSQNFGRGSKFPLPETTADHGDRSGANRVFSRSERAAYSRIDTEHGKKISRDEPPAQLFSLTKPSKVVRIAARQAHTRESLIVFLPVQKVREGDGASRKILFTFRQPDQLLGMRVRQRIEQYAVHYGKQSGVRTDTQRQRENGDRGESRRFQKHPQTIARILHQFFKRSPAPHLPGDLLDQADIAQLSTGNAARFFFGFTAVRSVFDRHSQMAF
jgi:hypothetical protein